MRSSIKWALVSWLVLRVVSSAGALFAVTFLEVGDTVSVPNYEPPELGPFADLIAGVWLRADALWYLKISQTGYDVPGAFAFFPLFPLLVRATTPLFGNELWAGLVVANAATLAGFFFLYEAFRRIDTEKAGRAGTLALAVFPTAFFLVAPYGESFFFCAGAAAVFFTLIDRRAQAGLAGVLAALSRPFGILIAIPMFALARRGSRWPALGPPIGLVIWVGFVASRTSDLLGAFRVQTIWQREPMFFAWTAIKGVKAVYDFRATEFVGYIALDLLALITGAAATWMAGRALVKKGERLPGIGMALFGFLVLALPMSSVFAPRPLLSMPRFILALFPFAFVAGRWDRNLRVIAAAASGLTLFALAALYVAARPIF